MRPRAVAYNVLRSRSVREVSVPRDRDISTSSIQERLLHFLGRDPESAGLRGATVNYTIANSLDFAQRTIPDFFALIREKSVLDFGCGFGWQAVAMALNGAARVCAVDIRDDLLQKGRELARTHGVSDRVTFTTTPEGVFDIVLSLNAFEHYADPKAELARMASLAVANGLVIISFAEPWYSHSGSHMNDYISVPWLNLLFTERAVLNWRRRYRGDNATRYEDIEGGLNRMTVSKFERLVAESGLKVVTKRLHATKRLPFVTSIPVVRELLTSSCCVVLRKPKSDVNGD